MTEFVHRWDHEGQTVTYTWLGEIEDVTPDRVYAFAFTPELKMLLVSDETWAPKGWLPGGGIEPNETPEQALARELLEEADADVKRVVRLGTQRADHSKGLSSFEIFYWCRVTVNKNFSPRHEVTKRYVIEPREFLDTLFWGRIDPKAPMLLKRALEMETIYGSQ